jgi:hypothetical protein
VFEKQRRGQKDVGADFALSYREEGCKISSKAFNETFNKFDRKFAFLKKRRKEI